MVVIKNSVYYKSIYYVFIMVIFGVLAYVFFISGFNTETKVRVTYNHGSETIYKVNFIDDNYSSLYSDKYVADMVDTINISYNYDNIFSEYISGYYKYNVEGYLIAYENDIRESLWERKYQIVDDKNIVIDGNDINDIKIYDNFVIDFQKYRDEVKEFIDEYDIDISAYLQVRINILEFLNFNNMNNEYADNKIITINIPLTEDIFKINVNDIDRFADENINCYYEFTSNKTMNIVFVIIGAFCFSFALTSLVMVFRQIKFIYERESKYKKELRRILSKYDECIVRVKQFYINKKYNMIYVDSFDELMDVYNTRAKMISYKEVKRDSESLFVIIDGDDAWIYRLNVLDFE